MVVSDLDMASSGNVDIARRLEYLINQQMNKTQIVHNHQTGR